MKKFLSIIFSVLVSLSLNAQLDRSQRPEAGPATELDFGDYKVYELDNGLKLIVVEDHKLPSISMRLLIDRDPVLEGDEAGFVGLAGDMLRQGTTNRPKDKLDEEIDFIGANLFTGSNLIYTSGLSKYTEKLFEIMADVAQNPAFPEEEFAKLKKQEISGLESAKDDPETVGGRVFDAVLYGKDHPYGELTTIATVEKVELEDVQTYYKNYWIPNNAYIAVVGDIKKKDAYKMVKKYFGEWKQGNIARNTFQTPEVPSSPEVAFVHRESSVQSVIMLGNTIDLKPGDPDIIKLQIANQILGGGSLGRLFQNIREDKGYTYGAYSNYSSDRLVGEFSASASVRNEVTDSAIAEFLYEFNRIRTEPVSAEELQGAKNFVIGSFGRSLESAQTRGSYALNIQRYNLPKDYYSTYVKKIESVTVEDVMAAAKKYITPDHILITVVGKGTTVAEKLEKFGEIQFYDENAEPTDPPSMKLPEGLTAEKVILNYVNALGGKENLLAVNDITMKYDAEVQGQELNATILRKRPDMYKMEITSQGMTLMSQVYNGKSGKLSGMGGSKELEGEELEEMASSAKFNPELNYFSEDYQLELAGMANVDGTEAYMIKVTNKNGTVTTEYYDVNTGLKIKEEQTQDTPAGPMTSSQTFMDYKVINGVKYPHKMIILQGPQKIKMTAYEILVNSGVTDDAFN